jgi:hypothetical protein
LGDGLAIVLIDDTSGNCPLTSELSATSPAPEPITTTPEPLKRPTKAEASETQLALERVVKESYRSYVTKGVFKRADMTPAGFFDAEMPCRVWPRAGTWSTVPCGARTSSATPDRVAGRRGTRLGQ